MTLTEFLIAYSIFCYIVGQVILSKEKEVSGKLTREDYIMYLLMPYIFPFMLGYFINKINKK